MVQRYTLRSPVTATLIALSIGITLLGWSFAPWLFNFAAGVHPLGWYSLLELALYQFLHLSTIHLLSNMLFAFMIGSVFEQSLGRTRAIWFVIGNTVFVYLALYFLTAHGTVTAWMSGLLMAMLGYLTVVAWKMHDPQYRSMLLFVVINILLGFYANISLIGHTAGAVYGALVWLYLTNKYQ